MWCGRPRRRRWRPVAKHPAAAANDGLWKLRAVCRGHDPELWFPGKRGVRPMTRKQQMELARRRAARQAQAKAICMECPVRAECLEWAKDNDEREGIWGGLTPQERGVQPLR